VEHSEERLQRLFELSKGERGAGWRGVHLPRGEGCRVFSEFGGVSAQHAPVRKGLHSSTFELNLSRF
jgi:hypothetical protein